MILRPRWDRGVPEPIHVRATDPRLDALRDMTNQRRGPVVVEGQTFVARAIASRNPVRYLVSVPSRRDGLKVHARSVSTWFEMDPADLQALMGFRFHRGVVAVLERPSPLQLAAWIRDHALDDAWTVLLASRLSDPANVGAVIRNARAFGADLVVFDAACADPWGRKAIRAAAGYTFEQPWLVAEDLMETMIDLKRAGGRLIATSLRTGAVSLRSYRDPSTRRVWLFGNEGDGLEPSLFDRADDEVWIPMQNNVDSLNVAAAVAVVLWAN